MQVGAAARGKKLSCAGSSTAPELNPQAPPIRSRAHKFCPPVRLKACKTEPQMLECQRFALNSRTDAQKLDL